MALTAAEALAAATAQVDHYCTDPPAAVRTAAIGRLANYLQRYPSDGVSSISHADQTASWQKNELAGALHASGAAALLSAWRRPRGRIIEAAS